ncbi:MAG: HAD-IIB family hydrolase, partial [Anaerococcus sp.]|nr:HAD-IIB family hydrolase [Anaerococcus sp.]
LSKSIDFGVNKILFSKAPHIMETQSKIFIDKYKDLVNPIRSMPQFLDIMPKGINKGRSLIEIADYYKIDHKDTIAFGDEINDIEMIKAAGVGVAMGNASEDIKKAAKFITLSNDENGVAVYLNKLH